MPEPLTLIPQLIPWNEESGGAIDEASKRAKRSAVVKGWGCLYIHKPRSVLQKDLHEKDIWGAIGALIMAYLYVGKTPFMLNHNELTEFQF